MSNIWKIGPNPGLDKKNRRNFFLEKAFQEGFTAVGWAKVDDLRTFKNEKELEILCKKNNYAGRPQNRAWEQLWMFADKIELGDIIIQIVKSDKQYFEFRLGRISKEKPYYFVKPGASDDYFNWDNDRSPHRIKVKWESKNKYSKKTGKMWAGAVHKVTEKDLTIVREIQIREYLEDNLKSSILSNDIKKEKQISLIKNFANELFEYLKNSFKKNAQYSKDKDLDVYKKLKLRDNLSIQFRPWADRDRKKYFIILYRNLDYIMEFDLSRVIFNDDNTICWILNTPTRTVNRRNLECLGYPREKIDKDVVEKIHRQMMLINDRANRTNYGYWFCNNKRLSIAKKKFGELIVYTVNQVKELNNKQEKTALEGITNEYKYLNKKRCAKLVSARKEKDRYICQACNNKYEINGRYIIECHHIYPLRGKVITSINDLVCLCPTCHRIAHANKDKNKPYSINKIKNFLRNNI